MEAAAKLLLNHIQSLDPQTAAIPPEVGKILQKLVTGLRKLGIGKRLPKGLPKRPPSFPKACLDFPPIQIGNDCPWDNDGDPPSEITTSRNNNRTESQQIRQAYLGFQRSDHGDQKQGCDRRLRLLNLADYVEQRYPTANNKPRERLEAAAIREIATELECTRDSLTEVREKTERYLDIIAQTNTVGFVEGIDNGWRSHFERKTIRKRRLPELVEQWRSDGTLEKSFARDRKIFEQLMRIREECGGTREELLSSNTKLSKSLRVISERIRVGNTATPHQEVPHPTPGVSWPRYLGRVSREASGETNQRVPEQPASGDVDSIGNDLPCLTDGSNEGITTQSTNKPKRAREVPALEAEAERSDGSTYKRQRSTILPGCTTAHYGGVDGTASDQYNQQQPHTYGEMPTPPLSGHELDECSMSMSQEAIQATEAHMGEVGQPFPTSINSLHSSASRVLSCNTVQHFGGTTNQPIPDPSEHGTPVALRATVRNSPLHQSNTEPNDENCVINAIPTVLPGVEHTNDIENGVGCYVDWNSIFQPNIDWNPEFQPDINTSMLVPIDWDNLFAGDS